MEQAIVSTVEKLVQAGVVERSQAAGCSLEEMAQIENDFGVTLPRSYKEFLRLLGRSSGDFLHGTTFNYPGVIQLREMAIELLESCGSEFSLAPSDFVFLGHQGYQFMFFDTAVSDDPPVIYYIDQESAPKQIFESFSAWFSVCADDEIDGFMKD